MLFFKIDGLVGNKQYTNDCIINQQWIAKFKKK